MKLPVVSRDVVVAQLEVLNREVFGGSQGDIFSKLQKLAAEQPFIFLMLKQSLQSFMKDVTEVSPLDAATYMALWAAAVYACIAAQVESDEMNRIILP
jgi:hypothetical protein